MLKATAGGGGKGARCFELEQFLVAWDSARQGGEEKATTGCT